MRCVYTEYFGLREMPFSVTPDPRFCYANRGYEEAYATLLYGVRERKGFIVLTGEVGTGKTTVLHRLMQTLEPQTPFVFFFNPRLDFDDILAFACNELRLAADRSGRLAKIQVLYEFLLRQLRNGATTAFLIDEAQGLTDETLEDLRLLSNLETTGEKLLQIALVGQPELEIKLAQPGLRQLRQRIALRCRLEQLKGHEVGPYIQRRLRTAGGDGEELFTSEAVLRIAEYSRGIPRLINAICDNALLIGYGASQKTITHEIIEEVVGDLALARESPGGSAGALGLENALRVVEEASSRAQGRKRRFRRFTGFLRAGTAMAVFVLALVSGAPITDDESWIEKPKGDALEAVSSNPVLFDQAASRAEEEAIAAESPARPEEFPSGAVSEGISDSEGRIEGPPSSEAQEIALVSYTVQKGLTAYGIASEKYGRDVYLALDILSELNPDIENLDWIFAGQELWLPNLSRMVRVRERDDGSYCVILASFNDLRKAKRFSSRVEAITGYGTRVTPRRISATVLLQRVEISDLRGAAEADRAWTLALSRNFFAPEF